MNTNEFLEKLHARTGGKIIKSDDGRTIRNITVRNLATLYADYRHHYINIDFVDTTEILFEVSKGTPHLLLIRPENVISKILDKINLSPEVKIGDAAFDSKYIIQNVSAEQAKKTINQGFIKQISEIAPFIEFEMADNVYRLLKFVDIDGDYTVDKAVSDLDIFIELVDSIKSTQ